jgi:hypothetical protein
VKPVGSIEVTELTLPTNRSTRFASSPRMRRVRADPARAPSGTDGSGGSMSRNLAARLAKLGNLPPTLFQALAREALIEIGHAKNGAAYLADFLPDPSRW